MDLEQIKKAKKEYYKKWRENNKEKVKKHNENYWKKRVEKLLKEEQDNER